MRNGFSSPVRFDLMTLSTLGMISPLFSIITQSPIFDSQTLDLVFVVQRRARDCRAGEKHWLEIGNRSQRAGASHLNDDVQNLC